MLSRRILVVQLTTTARPVAALAFASIALIPDLHVIALATYLVALVTDLADGALARSLRAESRFGSYYDGFADKSLDVVSLLFLAVRGGSLVAAAVVMMRHLLTLTIRAATHDETSGSRLLGALNGVPLRVGTLLAMSGIGGDKHWKGALWIAATVSALTAAREIWFHRRSILSLFGGEARP